jgi:PAS domain S-box-containing protein
MQPLRKSLMPSSSDKSAGLIVGIVILLQLLLLTGYYYGEAQQQFNLHSPTWVLLLAYSAAMTLVALWAAWLRARWLKHESLVRQRLLDVIDAIPDPAAVRDVRGRYVMWNKAAEAYHGIKLGYVFQKTPLDLFPESLARIYMDLDAQAMETGQPVARRQEIPPIYGKGKRIAMLHIAPISSNAEPGARGTVSILHDITESETESAQLKHLSMQLKIALDTSGFGGWIWDLDQDVLSCSEQFQRLLHYSGDNFRRDFVFRERLHPEDRERVLEAVRRSIQTPSRFEDAYRLLAFDGKYYAFRASGQFTQDTQGKKYFAGLLVPASKP